MTEARYRLRLLLWTSLPVLILVAAVMWPVQALFASVSVICAKCALETA